MNKYIIQLQFEKCDDCCKLWQQMVPQCELQELIPEWELIYQGSYDDVSNYVRKLIENSEMYIDKPKYKIKYK